MSLRIAFGEARWRYGPRLRASIGWLRRTPWVRGVPAGLTFEVLDDVCRRHCGEALHEVSHARLPVGKAGYAGLGPLGGDRVPLHQSVGVTRLVLRTKGGRRWTVIYKNEIRPDHLPAFTEYWFYGNDHQVPGCSTEYMVYGHGENALAEYLPAVYCSSELSPGRHYQYLLEDLTDYRRASGPAAILAAARALPAIHRALNEAVVVGRPDRLFRADSLRECMATQLERYASRTGEPMVAEVGRRWLRDDGTPLTNGWELSAVHGDFRVPDNVLVHGARPDRIKIVDWESVALDLPYQDLVYLLEGAPPVLQENALAVYADADRGLPLEEHRRRYHWCCLQMSLRNLAWYALQHMESASTERLRLPWYIRWKVDRVLHRYRQLTQTGHALEEE